MDYSDDNLFSRIHQLAHARLEGSLGPAEQQELERLLLGSELARRAYVEYVQECASLRWFCLEELSDPVELARPEINERQREARRRLANMLMRGTLACMLAVALGGWLYSNSRKVAAERTASVAAIVPPGNEKTFGNVGADAAAAKPEQVATITGLASAQWSKLQNDRRLLSRCGVGERLLLDDGAAELTFDAGAQVTIFGPADFEITSPTSIRCTTGRANALVDERGKGFTIQTPQAKVVDLGTQFGLAVSKDGETDVVVFQGIVDTSSPEAATGDERTRRMRQGEALRVNKAGEFERLMSIERNHFMVRPKHARNRTPVVAAVRDNIRKADNLLSYQIVHSGLEEDAPSFVDRFHQWNGVTAAGLPVFLVGADYVMPFNNDKFVRALKLEIDLVRPATLYVFFDKNMEVPDWLRRDFMETGAEIGLDGSRTEWHEDNSLDEGAGRSVDFLFSVWRRDVKRAGTVMLGGVNPPQIGTRSSGFNMYGIAAVAIE